MLSEEGNVIAPLLFSLYFRRKISFYFITFRILSMPKLAFLDLHTPTLRWWSNLFLDVINLTFDVETRTLEVERHNLDHPMKAYMVDDVEMYRQLQAWN